MNNRANRLELNSYLPHHSVFGPSFFVWFGECILPYSATRNVNWIHAKIRMEK